LKKDSQKEKQSRLAGFLRGKEENVHKQKHNV